MSNAMYDKGREAFGNGAINWVADTIKAVLIDLAAYTPNLATDQFLSVIPGGALIGAPQTLTGKTNVAGVFNAAAISVTGLTSAPSIEAIAIYKDTGSSASSPLIALIDTATGLPTASGVTQVDVSWSTGANKIMKL